MVYFGIFIVIGVLFLYIAEKTKVMAFKGLKVYRKDQFIKCYEGEKVKITTTIENRRRMPIWFLFLEESLPISVRKKNSEKVLNYTKKTHNSLLTVWGHERVRRTYEINPLNRGVYKLNSICANIGDVFALSTKAYEIEDNSEIIIYPKLKDTVKFVYNNTSIMGSDIVKRWIYHDPLMIKGIKEYTSLNSFRDIHWKSSLKQQKLMVKDYDFTTDMEITFILNVQCGTPYYTFLDDDAVDRAVDVSLSLIRDFQHKGIKAGIWTNSQLMGVNRKAVSKIPPSTNNFNEILDMCARIDSAAAMDIVKYLEVNKKNFNIKNTYIFITSYLNDDICLNLLKLRNKGYIVKIIDVSISGLKEFGGIDIIHYKEK